MPRASLVLALLVCAVIGLAAQDAPRPMILNVTMSAAGDQLTISGNGFGSAPLVTIDGQPATVLPGSTDTQVSVVTPAVLLTTSGTFRLTVFDSVQQVGEAFVVTSRAGPVVSLTGGGNATSGGGIIASQRGVTSGTALSGGGVVGISAIENANPPFNTALGYLALSDNTSGTANTATGWRALSANSTGMYNTSSGYSALGFNTAGSENAALGTWALYLNGTGSSNTASGARALYSNDTGSYNTATGSQALMFNTGSSNTATGYQAMGGNTTGIYNTASGAQALNFNSTGFDNTASGTFALYNNTTGFVNTALGFRAGYNATTGNNNVFLGALVIGTAADNNTMRLGLPYGGGTGQKQTFIAGIRDTAVSGGLPVVVDIDGKMGTAGGTTPLSVLDATNTQPYQLRVGFATGSADYGIGRNPGDGVLDFTASQGTYSGFRFTTPNAGAALAIANNGVVSVMDRTNTQPYQLRVGYLNGVYDYAVGRNPNDGYLNFAASQGTYSGYRFNTPNAGAVLTIGNNGNVGIGVTAPSQPIQLASGAYVSAGGVWTNASSRSLKDQIAPLSTMAAIQAVAALSPVTFVYKAAPSESHVGFIAEDVPDLVATQDRRSLATMDLLAVVTKVVQDQQQRLHEQDATVADLRARLARLEALLAREQ